MLKKLDSTIVIALCTSAALMVFAFYQRYEASVTMPGFAFYVSCRDHLIIACVLRFNSSQDLSKQTTNVS